MDVFKLSRQWFDFCFENPELINPCHTAIYFFAIEHCNRLGWKQKFGFPTQMTMDALGIKKHQTYIKYFNDIIAWGGFTLIQKSTNQYSANIISINAMPKNGKALDKAFITHAAKHGSGNGQSKDSINIQETNIQETKVYRSFKHLSMTTDEYKKIIEQGYTAIQLMNILDDIENYSGNKKYTSLYLTALKWLKKEKPKSSPLPTFK
jgi:hypothetical protein